jgi:phenylalanyl-tRNA synthetase beta subunit
VWLFDTFEKEGKTSLAYRIILQSFERTLTEDEVNKIMEKVSAMLKALGFEIR